MADKKDERVGSINRRKNTNLKSPVNKFIEDMDIDLRRGAEDRRSKISGTPGSRRYRNEEKFIPKPINEAEVKEFKKIIAKIKQQKYETPLPTKNTKKENYNIGTRVAQTLKKSAAVKGAIEDFKSIRKNFDVTSGKFKAGYGTATGAALLGTALGRAIEKYNDEIEKQELDKFLKASGVKR